MYNNIASNIRMYIKMFVTFQEYFCRYEGGKYTKMIGETFENMKRKLKNLKTAN